LGSGAEVFYIAPAEALKPSVEGRKEDMGENFQILDNLLDMSEKAKAKDDSDRRKP